MSDEVWITFYSAVLHIIICSTLSPEGFGSVHIKLKYFQRFHLPHPAATTASSSLIRLLFSLPPLSLFLSCHYTSLQLIIIFHTDIVDHILTYADLLSAIWMQILQTSKGKWGEGRREDCQHVGINPRQRSSCRCMPLCVWIFNKRRDLAARGKVISHHQLWV